MEISKQLFFGPNIYVNSPGVLFTLSVDNSVSIDNIILGESFGDASSFKSAPIDISGMNILDGIISIVSYFFEKQNRPLEFLTISSEKEENTAFIKSIFPQVIGHALEYVTQIFSDISSGTTITEKEWTEQYNRFFLLHGVGINTRLIADKAHSLGIPVQSIHRSMIQFGYGKNRKLVWRGVPEESSVLAVDIATYKSSLNRILEDLGYYIPRSHLSLDLEDAKQIADLLEYPVVVKSSQERFGRGTFADIRNPSELEEAYKNCSSSEERVIIQEFVGGNLYRLVVIGESVLAIQNSTPSITGDGEHTINELVERENNRPIRGNLDDAPLSRIPIGLDMQLTLQRQGYSLDDVLEEGVTVHLSSVSTVDTGAGSTDVTHNLHPLNEFLAKRISKALGLSIAEIHIVSDTISQPLVEGRGKIVALSPRVDLRTYHYPLDSDRPDIEKIMIESFFGDEDPSIPLIAISGSHGKTIVTAILDHLLRLTGYSTGLANSVGLYIDGSQVSRNSGASIDGHKAIMIDPKVDFAILEQSSLDSKREGLAFHRASTSVILNSYERREVYPELHEEIHQGRVLLLRSTKPDGFCVLNVAIPEFDELVKESAGEIVLISLDSEHPRLRDIQQEKHVIATVMGKMLVLKDKGKIIPLVNYQNAPLTFEGIAEFNIENLLAAAVTAYVNGVEPSDIRNALLSFSNRPKQLPGAMNQLEIDNRTVFVDLATKPSNITIASRFVDRYRRKMDLGNLYGLLRLPERTASKDIEKTLTEVATHFEKALVYDVEHPDIIAQCGGCFDVVDDFNEGFQSIWSFLEDNDILLITTIKPNEVLEYIDEIKENMNKE